eukprot:g8578.t1
MPLLSVSLQEPVSPALKLVRAARPVLRGVQWLANRVLGEYPAHGQCDCRDAASDSEDSDSWYLPQALLSEVSILDTCRVQLARPNHSVVVTLPMPSTGRRRSEDCTLFLSLLR